MTQRALTIVADTREQNPLIFPRLLVIDGVGRLLTVARKTMQTGDYTIEGYEAECCVERKATLSEIANNLLTADRNRALTALQRLAAIPHPLLVVEQGPGALIRPSKYAPNPAEALDALMRVLANLHIPLWLIGNCTLPASRRNAGELIVRWMCAQCRI